MMFRILLYRILVLIILIGGFRVSIVGQGIHKKELNALIIGNSYSRDAFSYMPMIIENMCPDVDINMQILYIGGVALDTHWYNIENQVQDFILDSYTTNMGKWFSYNQIKADSVISSKQWDCVILQEGGIVARSFDRTCRDIKPIIDYIKKIHNNTNFAFMINPTHPVGSEKLGDYTSDEEFCIITSVTEELLGSNIIDFVIPCGTAIQNARNTYLDNYGEFGHLSYEGRHLQEGMPCWIEAYTAAKALVKEFGLQEKENANYLKITNKWVKEKKIPGQHGKVIEGSDSDYRLAEICATKAIESPYTSQQTTVAEIFPKIFKPGHFNLEAHGGFSDEYPENTMLAFEQAGMSNAYDAIETVLRQTSDSVFVCLHDETIDRTTNGSGKINSVTYSQLQQYDIDGGLGWNNRYERQLKVPTFADFLEVCRLYDKIPYIELSSLSIDGVAAVISTLHDCGFEDGSYVLTSFSLKSLEYASTICDVPLEYMKDSFLDSSISNYSKMRNIVLRPSAKNITPTFIEKCWENGLITECYNIEVGNDSQLQNFITLGVWGGTCNSYLFDSMNREPVVIIEDVNSINSMMFDISNSRIYDLKGQRINKLQKGLNIIHQIDGSIKKLKY